MENKAPNGKPSNLTPEQYRLVRTPAFKKWFGDWENSPETASKVVDENGEPLVMHHCTNSKWNVYNKNEEIYLADYSLDNGPNSCHYDKLLFCKIVKPLDVSDIYPPDYGDDYTPHTLTEWKKILSDRGFNVSKLKFDSGLKKYGELNMYGWNEPGNTDYKYNFWTLIWRTMNSDGGKLWKGNGNFIEELKRQGFDGILSIPEEGVGVKIAFESTQIKLADGSNTTFDSSNPDIRFDDGGSVYNTGILRRSLNPYGAIGVIPEDIHNKQGLWQNYGQYDEIKAEKIYGEPEYSGYYLDKDGNTIRDIKTGDQLFDTWEDEGDGDKRVAATISNEQLKNDLIESFKTKEGKIYLSEVIAALPKNSDGSITAYRIGEIGDGIQSYTVSEGMAKTFSNQGTDIMPSGLTSLPREGYKEFGLLPTNVVKINPEWIVAWSPYDKELLVKSKYVKFSDGGSLNSFQQLANRYNGK